MRMNCWMKMTEMPIHYLLIAQQMKKSNFESHSILFKLWALFSCSFFSFTSISLLLFSSSCIDKFNLSKKGNVLQMIRIFEQSLPLMYRPFSCHTETRHFAHLDIIDNNGIAFYIVSLTQIVYRLRESF